MATPKGVDPKGACDFEDVVTPPRIIGLWTGGFHGRDGAVEKGKVVDNV